jgi:hypothetical protein
LAENIYFDISKAVELDQLDELTDPMDSSYYVTMILNYNGMPTEANMTLISNKQDKSIERLSQDLSYFTNRKRSRTRLR